MRLSKKDENIIGHHTWYVVTGRVPEIRRFLNDLGNNTDLDGFMWS